MLWGIPASLLSNAIVNGCPAGTSMQLVSNAMPEAVTATVPFWACVHCVDGDGADVGAPVGVGLGTASSRPETLPKVPSIRFWSTWSYQARYTADPSLVTPSEGRSPPWVSSTGIGWNWAPSAAEASRTLSVPGSYHVTYTVPPESTATPVPRPASFCPDPTSATFETCQDAPSLDTASWISEPA